MTPQPPDPHELIPAAAAPPAKSEGYVAANAAYAREILEDAAPGGLLEYWGILRRRKGAVLLFAFVGVLLAVLFTLPQTPVYQARASLEIQSLNQDFMNMKQVSPVAIAPTTGPTTSRPTSSSCRATRCSSGSWRNWKRPLPRPPSRPPAASHPGAAPSASPSPPASMPMPRP